MRIIEPHQLKGLKKQRNIRLPRFKVILLPALLTLAVLAYLLFGQNVGENAQKTVENQQNQPPSQPEQAGQRKLKNLSGEEFKKLYSSFAYPNTQPLTEKPTITGDAKADERIRMVAEKRGYKLSSVPVSNIAKTGEPGLTDDDLIQPNALLGWQEMKAAALKEGVRLQMTSAYRSIELQRALFLRRMQDDRVYVDSVATGYVDHLIEKLLTRAAPPGYSRHHTGYTIDLACDGVGLEEFVSTSCYSWLSKNNYENTKKYGFVPSYPQGAGLQGPEPEPWEYIWVSTYSLYE